jgi:tetratricopeptide (TPR) repeat protein
MKPTNEQEEFEWIEEYLFERLNGTEKAFFEEKLNNNLEFAKKVEDIKKTHNLLKESFIEDQVRKTLSTLQAKDRTINVDVLNKKPKTNSIFLGLSIASLAAIFICYLSFSTIDFPNTENDFNITRGVDTTKFTTEQRTAFSSFFDGQAHLVEGLYLLAIKDFEKSLKATDVRPYFKEAAQWHLAVAYMKSKQPEKAEKIYQSFENCEVCEYPVSKMSRWKLWWQIQLTKYI